MTISTSVHSNAFNFMSFLEGGPDPRTGQYTRTVTLPDVKANRLRGPGVPLALNYNPLNRRDSGYGYAWSLMLTQYSPSTQMVSLNTGDTFKVTGSNGMELLMEEKKIDSFHLFQVDADHYRVVYKSGQVEILQVLGSAEEPVALPVEIYAPDGHKVALEYSPFDGTHQILRSIKDDSGETLLSIERESTLVKILLLPFSGANGEPVARFDMILEGADKRVSKIVLPTENSASMRFGYILKDDQLCMSSVETPTGGREEIRYEDLGHLFPSSSSHPPLPRVTRHITYPGFGQPPIDVGFTYPDNEHNFLGWGLPISWQDNGRDNLFQHLGDYLYGSVETLYVNNQPVREIEREFNRFHLLTKEKTTQNNAVQAVETTYYITSGAPFTAQPNYFQLPMDSVESWSLANDATKYRSETTSSTYDTSGNVLMQKQANGVVETNTWYPETFDPARFVRHLKDKTVTPAPSPNGQAPTLRTSYSYEQLKPLAGSPLSDWLTVKSEVLEQVTGTTATELERTEFATINDPADPFLHGRIERQTLTMNGQSTVTGYEYSLLDGPVLKQSVLQTVQTLTGFDHLANGKHVQKTITLQHSVLTGEPRLTQDDADVKIEYDYDALRRVIRETVAPGTPFAASRNYEYVLCANPGDQAEQKLIDVKGVVTTVRFDGSNRPIYEERDDADNTAPGSVPRQTYAGEYDEFGRLVQETEYDWLGAAALALTTRNEYDDWGALCCTTGPDGVKTFEMTDPIGTASSQGPIQRSWRESTGATPTVSGVTETWLNLFDKPARTERFDLAKQRVSLQENFYDGLGRTYKEVVGFGSVQRETITVYDAFDRLIETILPDKAVVKREYATHNREDLPRLISVDGEVLGEQTFDGLDRRTQAITGGRKETFDYEPGQTQPKTVTNPNGEVIEYDYQWNLGEEPVLRKMPQMGATGLFEDATYEYDPKNARLIACQEQGIALTRDYYSTGEPKSEKRTVGDVDYTMHYLYSRLGRLMQYTDVLDQKQDHRYDVAGRLEYTVLGTTNSAFTYDNFGRTATIRTSDSASNQTVVTTLKYDEFDREIEREFDLDGLLQVLTQEYNDVDGLSRRTLKEGAVTLRDESYSYDSRMRLTGYTCTGTQPPVDPYGMSIKQQLFNFDALDNLTMVLTSFGSGTNRAQYFYENPDKTQLSKVTNTHQDYPTPIDLVYNPSGHLIRDEENRALDYDALGRLISVSDSSGGATRAHTFDPLNKLSGIDDGSGPAQRFYQNEKLVSQVSDAGSSTFMRGDDVLLAEQQAGASPKSLMLAGDQRNTVLSSLTTTGRVDSAYTAYGDRQNDASTTGAMGFNGEFREAGTGWYSLGNGERFYSPRLMKFHSPDNYGLFGEAGFNPYTYCLGNPVDFTDPSGNVPLGFGWIVKGISWLFSKAPARGAARAGSTASSNSLDDVSVKMFQKPVKAVKPTKVDKALKKFDFLDDQSAASSSRRSSVTSSKRASIDGHIYDEVASPSRSQSSTVPKFIQGAEHSVPAQVSIARWHKMNVFQRTGYTDRGGKEPIAISAGKVRRNVFDRSKHSRKSDWM